MSDRSIDDGRTVLELLLETVDVRCPQCGGHARLAQIDGGEPALHAPRRLSCFACGFTRHHDGTALGISRSGEDPCFGYPLWYRRETSKGRLWASHHSQLEEMRAYVAASNRDRSHMDTWRNQGYLTRLPGWVRSAKNREMVVKALDRMLADG